MRTRASMCRGAPKSGAILGNCRDFSFVKISKKIILRYFIESRMPGCQSLNLVFLLASGQRAVGADPGAARSGEAVISMRCYAPCVCDAAIES